MFSKNVAREGISLEPIIGSAISSTGQLPCFGTDKNKFVVGDSKLQLTTIAAEKETALAACPFYDWLSMDDPKQLYSEIDKSTLYSFQNSNGVYGVLES